MFLLTTIGNFFCQIFGGHCDERDQISGMDEIRQHNKRFLRTDYVDPKDLNPRRDPTFGVRTLPRNHADEYRFWVVGKPGFGFGMPAIARYRLARVPPNYRLE